MDRYMIWTSHTPPFFLLWASETMGEQIFSDGSWLDTKVICDYMYGHNDWVDDITEQEARGKFPAAFA